MIKKTIILNKGFGFVATVDIPINTIIKKEVPTFIVNETDIISESLQLIYNILTDADQTKIDQFKSLLPYDLENYHIDKNNFEEELNSLKTSKTYYIYKYLIDNCSTYELQLYLGKFLCNAFGFGLYSKPCILLESTYFNHSCSPNVLFGSYEQYGMQQMHFITCKNIQEGEELTISYIDFTLNKKGRQDALKQYNFTCKCERCVEKNRKKIKEYNKIARELGKKKIY